MAASETTYAEGLHWGKGARALEKSGPRAVVNGVDVDVEAGELARLGDGKAAKQRDLHEVHDKGENDRGAERPATAQKGSAAIAIPATARMHAIDVSATEDATSHPLGWTTRRSFKF